MWRVLKQSLLELTKKTSQRQNIYKSILFSLSYSKFTPDLTNKLGNCKAVTFKRWGVDNQLTLNCHKHPREQLLCEENLWIFPVYIPHTHTRALAHTQTNARTQTSVFTSVFLLFRQDATHFAWRLSSKWRVLQSSCSTFRVSTGDKLLKSGRWPCAHCLFIIIYISAKQPNRSLRQRLHYASGPSPRSAGLSMPLETSGSLSAPLQS